MAETLLIFLVFFLYAGWPAPAVNEAHYLAKAKHFWDPGWCPTDYFLNSADAHGVFYWSFGWLTCLLPLGQAAWIGRVSIWVLLAASWRGLSFAVIPQRGFSVLSAGLAICLWSRCHMAGEWVVGGVEAKGAAYVLVLLGLRALIYQQWGRTWLLLGAASAFHILVGGWSVVAAGIAWVLLGRDGRAPLSSMAPALFGGLILALPGLLPVLWLSWGVDSEMAWQANRIYVFRRLAHHLVLRELPAVFVARFTGLLILWCLVSRGLCRVSAVYARLSAFIAGAVLIALAGLVVELWTLANPYWASFWLRFYWFRLSDAMLPVGVVLAGGVLLQVWQCRRPVASQWLLVVLICTATVSLADQIHQRGRDPRPAADGRGTMVRQFGATDGQVVYLDWRDVSDWVRTNTARDAVFLTPLGQQTFKWYAQRGEVVTWKDIPQDAVGLIEWWKRYCRVRAFEMSPLPPAEYRERLFDLTSQYNVSYFLAVRPAVPTGTELRRVYANGSFAVYQVDHDGSAVGD